MTLVTVDAVVDIPRHVVVLEIVRVVAAMASCALEDGVVVRVDVAGRANSARIAVIGWELCVLGMVEVCVQPVGSTVAVLAGCREKLGLRRMARIRRVVVILQVTSDADRRQRGVIIVDVAVRTLPRWHRVRARQGEGRVVVVEGGIGPDQGVVTQLALCGEASCSVRRIGCARVIFLVTRVAGRAVQVVVVVNVAIGALPRRNRV